MSEVETYIKRPLRYENIDGTVEMFFGMMYLGFALQQYLIPLMPKVPGWGKVLLFIVPVYGVMAMGWWTGKVIKKRITWVRTGYVVPRQAANSRTAVYWVALVAAAAVMYVFIRGTKGQGLSSAARPSMLAALAATYGLFILLNRGPSWKWLAALVLALGLSLIGLLVPGGTAQLFRPAALFAGLSWLASGLITLYLYIRRTQPPAREPE